MLGLRRLATGIKHAHIANTARNTLCTSVTKAPLIVINKSNAIKDTATKAEPKDLKESCGTTTPDDELEELEEMYVMGPAGIEWNGPTRGGARPEPTRYKDWERKGRCTDF